MTGWGRRSVLALALCLAGTGAACSSDWPDEPGEESGDGVSEPYRTVWHARETWTIRTPDGLRLGSSVQRGRYSGRHREGRRGVSSSVDTAGEKPLIDLGDGKLLVIARYRDLAPGRSLAPAHGETFVRDPEIYKQLAALPLGTQECWHADEGTKNPFQSPRSAFTFGDPADPRTALWVDVRDLEAAFGPGYSVHSRCWEKTDDPVTFGPIAEAFPWLKEAREGRAGYIIPDIIERSKFPIGSAPQRLQTDRFYGGKP